MTTEFHMNSMTIPQKQVVLALVAAGYCFTANNPGEYALLFWHGLDLPGSRARVYETGQVETFED
jgi:hypothetical protein